MRTIQGWIGCVLVAIALVAVSPPQAQATTVASTFSATGASSALYVRAGEKARFILTNTFSATVFLEYTLNNGVSWNSLGSFTSTGLREIDAAVQDRYYRLRCSSYTSGIVTYYLENAVTDTERLSFSNIPIGSVAYGSLGSVLAPPVAGTLYTTDLVIRRKMLATGVKILNGATCGTDKYVAWLFDSSGRALASTSLSGTTCSGTDAFQTIAFTSTVLIDPGRYLVGIRVNGTTDRTRFVAGSTYPDTVCSAVAHSSLRVGSFGSSIDAIDVPTTFTAGQCPILQVYGTAP